MIAGRAHVSARAGGIGALFLLIFAMSGSKFARHWLIWIVAVMATALLAGCYFTRPD
jgi:hypothetical protein